MAIVNVSTADTVAANIAGLRLVPTLLLASGALASVDVNGQLRAYTLSFPNTEPDDGLYFVAPNDRVDGRWILGDVLDAGPSSRIFLFSVPIAGTSAVLDVAADWQLVGVDAGRAWFVRRLVG